jgi:hypothetical protein
MSIPLMGRGLLACAALTLLARPATLARHRSSQSVAEAQLRLLQLTVPDDMNTDVPVPVRDAIVELKMALAHQTDAIVQKLPSAATAAFAKQRLAQVMPLPKLGKISDDEWRKIGNSDTSRPLAGLYGGELTLTVRKPKPSLLLVQETFDIACGNDNVLLVYSNERGAWKRLLLWQSRPYTSIGEAFGDIYETLLLRPQRHGHPLLLVLHGTPWCSSTVSGFSMDVFELGTTSPPLWHGEHGYRRLDFDPPLTLRSTADGFEVRTSVNVWGEGDRVSRKGIMRYAVTLDGIHRAEPIGVNAHDSVEEWLQMPRTEAARFVDEQHSDSLIWTMFQEFTLRGKPEDADIPLANVGAVHACKDDRTHFQADITSTALAIGVPGGKPGPAFFVQLRQVANGYRIHTVTSSKDPACGGHDLMAP